MVARAKKEATVEELKSSLLNAKLAVVSDYMGTNVSEITSLRREIQKAGGDFTVAKNTLIKIAVKDSSFASELDEFLSGPTAVAYTDGDPVPVAKALMDYIKKAKKTTIRGGVLEGKKLTEAGVKSLAEMPSKEVLISRLLGSMSAPAQKTVYALSGVSRNLVYVLEAIRKQKAEQG